MARGYAESRKTEKTRLSHARAFCTAVIASYWETLCKRHKTTMKVRPMPLPVPTLAIDVQRTANDVGSMIAVFPVEDAGYLIGSIYTVMLPTALRSQLGAYYTPPPLVTRLLDLAEQAGFDFTHGTVINPAWGGGAFLAPVALRMATGQGCIARMDLQAHRKTVAGHRDRSVRCMDDASAVGSGSNAALHRRKTPAP
jgi:hypothetical protein